MLRRMRPNLAQNVRIANQTSVVNDLGHFVRLADVQAEMASGR
jgi:hypothetical protein